MEYIVAKMVKPDPRDSDPYALHTCRHCGDSMYQYLMTSHDCPGYAIAAWAETFGTEAWCCKGVFSAAFAAFTDCS